MNDNRPQTDPADIPGINPEPIARDGYGAPIYGWAIDEWD